MIAVERFERFFRAVNDGHAPYPWQSALVRTIAETGRWPSAIAAPTGSGKSSVVDVHVFLVAERERTRHGDGSPIARPPRRLVLVAPRRVLVDDQFERARRLRSQLVDADLLPDEGGIVREVADALGGLVTTASGDGPASPLGVARLRGGVLLDHAWRLDPAQCQIICTTPQMWGSRLLLRGYRGSRRSRNLEAGLLGHDVTVVVDEAHLHERLTETSVRVASDAAASMGLQVVAMSATRSAADAHRLTAADLQNEELGRRVRANKAAELVEVDDWRREAASAIAKRARELHGKGTVGVFVNTVTMAIEVAAQLDGTVALVCGRMRPADLDRLRSDHPGLLDRGGNADVDFLVTTQSLEVGVDLDLPAMVTAIAPASALAQRAGRLNRSGSRLRAVLSIVAPRNLAQADPRALERDLAPYAPAEIVAAAAWVRALQGDASPERISDTPLPAPDPVLLPVLSRVDLDTLAMTSGVHAADPDIGFYVEEPRDRVERSVSIGARRHLELPRSIVRQALLAAPPRAHELASMPMDGKALRGVLAASPHSWVLRMVDGVRSAEPLEEVDALRDGDAIVVPAGSRICTHGVIGVSGRRASAIDDVMALRGDGEADAVALLERKDVEPIVEADRALGGRLARRALADLADAEDAAVAKRLRDHHYLRDIELTWCTDDEAEQGLLVVRSAASEGRVPTVAVTEEPVTVDAHGADVEARMRTIVVALDAPPDLGARTEQLLAAARWHDEGKRHPRFQERMGGDPALPALAKPRPGRKSDRGDGWRHEQLSAAVAWARSGGDGLVSVLVAAHHGHGRLLFERDAEEALDGWAQCDGDTARAMQRLFGRAGCYEAERVALRRSLGVHRLAYLEALLRCADMQVSREGR